MAVTDLFASEIAAELLKTLIAISLKSCLHKSSAKQLISSIEQLQPIILEIKYSGLELPAFRQSQLDRLSETLRDGLELSHKVLASPRWNVFKSLQLARKMKKLDRTVRVEVLVGPGSRAGRRAPLAVRDRRAVRPARGVG
ncbi:hypothetical protein FH972_018573 [Carpinus fangiana]|uniref:RPW8 domain-containing protein n=1 Tax=Carpinus fangiana TaxID=176857 RepID=A0A5N6RPK1_9ROSI|nr:hypothetical protein FH972_018573 [Carpinus fangiana]